jgi:oligosaccharide repeat unit polymerase
MTYLLCMLLVLLGLGATIGAPLFGASVLFCLYFVGGVAVPYGLAVFDSDARTTLVYPLNSDAGTTALVLLCASFTIAMFAAALVRRTAGPVTRYRVLAERNAQTSRRLALLAIVSGAVYLAVFSGLYGGVEGAIRRLYLRTQLGGSIANYLSVLSTACLTLPAFSFYLRPHKSSLSTNVIVSLSVIAGAVIALISGGRSILIIYIYTIFVGWLTTIGLTRRITFAIVGAMLAIVISYSIITLRYTVQGAVALQDTGDIFFERALTGFTFVDHVALSMSYASSVGHDFGQLYLNSILSFVPRDLWAGKDIPLSTKMFAYLLGDTTGGIPPGLFGESFIAFSAFGPILVSPILGFLLGKVDTVFKLAARLRCPVRMALAGVLAPLVGFVLVRGGIDIGAFRIGVPLIWCAVALYLISRGRPRRWSTSDSSKPIAEVPTHA